MVSPKTVTTVPLRPLGPRENCETVSTTFQTVRTQLHRFNIRKWLDPSGEVHPQTWENIDMFLRLFCWLLFRVVSRAPTKKFLKILKYGKLFGVETSAHTLRGALFKSILDPRVILLYIYIYMLMCFNMRCTGKNLLRVLLKAGNNPEMLKVSRCLEWIGSQWRKNRKMCEMRINTCERWERTPDLCCYTSLFFLNNNWRPQIFINVSFLRE